MSTEKNVKVKKSISHQFTDEKDHSLRIKEKVTIHTCQDYTIKEKQRTEKLTYKPTGIRTVVKQTKHFIMDQAMEILIVETETFAGAVGEKLTPLFNNTRIHINPINEKQ